MYYFNLRNSIFIFIQYVGADLAYCVYHLLVVIFYHEGAQFGIEKLINITTV